MSELIRLCLLGFVFFIQGLALAKNEESTITYADLTLEGLREEMIHIAAQIQEFETRALDIEATLHELDQSVIIKESHIEIQQAIMGRTMQSVMHLAQTSPLLMTLTHQDPNDVVRTGILLKTIVPELKFRSDVLMQQFAELQKLKQRIEQQKGSLAHITQGMLSKQITLAQLYEHRAKATASQPKVEIDSQLLASSSMPELLDNMVKNKIILKALKQSVKELALNPPVQGRVLTTFDKEKTHNPYGRGVVIQTRLGAQVVSPVTGAVVFAGPFRGYGKILILGSAQDYHVILAGLESIDVIVGQNIFLGEPVGRMPPAGKESKLYLELRKKAETIDPTPWVAKWNQ